MAEERQRCLHCWVNTVFEGNVHDGRYGVHTVRCGCVDVCPENCTWNWSRASTAFDFAPESTRRPIG